MNIHECASCADDVINMATFRSNVCMGRLASIDNCQPHSYLWTNILHVWLKICRNTSILQIPL